MSTDYIVSSLPSLQFDAPAPMGWDRFVEACGGEVPESAKWRDLETQLRNAVAEARGVILLAAYEKGVPVYEYTPLQVKQAVTGFGQALKPQVQEMTRRLLALKEMPKPDDTADALALAICHAHGKSILTNRDNQV